jgi:hypothetical protein
MFMFVLRVVAALAGWRVFRGKKGDFIALRRW